MANPELIQSIRSLLDEKIDPLRKQVDDCIQRVGRLEKGDSGGNNDSHGRLSLDQIKNNSAKGEALTD